MSEPGGPPVQRSGFTRWAAKFRDAGDGFVHGVRTQASLWVHCAFTLAVIAVAAGLRIESWQWAMLVLCIAVVLACELLNSAIEQLVKTLHPQRDPSIAAALHMAAGAVLVAAIGAAIVGLIILGPPLLEVLTR